MEKPPNSSKRSRLRNLLIFLQFLSFPLPFSAAGSTPTRFFINCGSASNVTIDDRTFIGDLSPKSFSISNGKSVAAPPVTQNHLYQTARIFTKPSRYEFGVAPNSIYLLRLHFSAFHANLSTASFDVSTSSFALLRNFTAANSSISSPVLTEFYVPVGDSSNLRIYFFPLGTTPSSSSSPPLAFVNAVEVLPLSPNFFPNDSNRVVPPRVTGRGNVEFRLSAFRTVYRVDIGGRSQDTYTGSLWRQWRPELELYATPSVGNATADSGMESPPDWADLAVPNFVLGSCRSETAKNGAPNPANLTWRFQVERNTKQFLRLYFFNCVGSQQPANFSLYIGDIRETITQEELRVPFFREFVADSDGSRYLNISIIPETADENGYDKYAYLNALEIMEFLSNTTVNDSQIEIDKPTTKSRRNLVIGLSVAGGVAVLMILGIVTVLVMKFKRRNSADSVKKSSTASGKKSHSWMTVNTTTHGSPLPELNLKLKMPFAEILAATDNFNPSRLIGSGGFGKVYEGELVNGVKVAVKRSESGHGQGLPEFQTEVLVLSKIRHRHLVSLIGYCDEGAEMVLVYEFMKNGTLREYLYSWGNDSTCSVKMTPSLSWKQRLEICLGSAKGLDYLHTGSDGGGIIHRDVKSTNILLDDNFVAKVADFGLSQSGPPDPDNHSMALKGSFGYLDPEFFRTLELTDKSDVYSFGVVMLEVLCARQPIVNSLNAEEINLAEWGLMWLKKGEIEKIIDPSIAGEINPSSLRKFAEVAEKCLRQNGVDRPTMLDVCWDLEYAYQLQKSRVNKEPSEDSMANASSNIIGHVAGGSSYSFTVDEGKDDFSMGDGFGDTDVTGS